MSGSLFDDAWLSLSEAKRGALRAADPALLQASLEAAAAVATVLRGQVAHRSVCARKAERDLLELAAKELKLLVVPTGSSPHSLDGHFFVQGGGCVGVEVKSGATTVPSDEVDKFRRDLAQGAYAAGLFVSTRAAIAKTPRGVYVSRDLTLRGVCFTVFVSPAGGDVFPLLKNGLALSKLLAEMDRANDKLAAEHLGCEVEVLGQVRKRLRDESEEMVRRIDRASDALCGVQQRLGAYSDECVPCAESH